LLVAALSFLLPGAPAGPGPVAVTACPPDALVAACRCKETQKDMVLDDLMAGRCTFARAVTRFEEIEAQFPALADGCRRGLRATFPDVPDDDRLAYSVVAHCAVRLRDRPERAVAVLARLDAELAAFVWAREHSAGSGGHTHLHADPGAVP